MRIFDGHNDVLSRLHEAGGDNRAFLDGDAGGHLSLPSAREGGMAGGLFAVFPHSPFRGEEEPENVDYMRAIGQEEALADTRAMAARLEAIEGESAGAVRIIRDVDQLDASLDDGALAAVLHLEGAEAIGPDLGQLTELYQTGLRSLGIVWSRPNDYGHGVSFSFPGDPDEGPGLTDAGRALVRECNALGVLVDTSHLTERGFWNVAEVSDAPLVASHSNAHALCPSPRNLTDDQLRAIGESGGVAGLNFHIGMVREDGAEDPDTPLSALAAHAAHMAELAGVESVALGSDFDGATMPLGLADASRLPALFDALRAFGFDEESLERIALGNWRRVLAATWRG